MLRQVQPEHKLLEGGLNVLLMTPRLFGGGKEGGGGEGIFTELRCTTRGDNYGQSKGSPAGHVTKPNQPQSLGRTNDIVTKTDESSEYLFMPADSLQRTSRLKKHAHFLCLHGRRKKRFLMVKPHALLYRINLKKQPRIHCFSANHLSLSLLGFYCAHVSGVIRSKRNCKS